MENRGQKLRIGAVGATMFCCAIGLVYSGWQLQINEHDYYANRAERQQRASIRFKPKRGNIYDRNGEGIAVNVTLQTVYALANKIADPWEAAVALAPLLGEVPDSIYKKFTGKSNFSYLARKIDPALAARIRSLELEGIYLADEDARFYPNLHLAAQVLGFIGVDGKGLEGIENSYNETMSGGDSPDPETIVLARDGLGNPIASDGGLPSLPEGASVELTIDRSIQFFAEDELEKTAKKFEARRGTAIVIDPRNGHILAIANWPFFNPNDFGSYAPALWRNRAIADQVEPGSTVKPLAVAAALEENVLRSNDIIFCENGSFDIGNFKITDDKKSHGWLSVSQIVSKSSNIGAAKIALELGRSRLHDYYARYSFGQKVEIGLPGEARGVMRPVKRWSELDTAAAGFGQGFSVTSLQLAIAYSTIANRGVRKEVSVVKRVVDEYGREVKRFEPKVVERIFSEKTGDLVTNMLIAAAGPHGTGERSAVDGFTVAGKTGTAQMASEGGYSEDRFVAGFAGFVPAEDPRLVIVVQVVEPRGSIYGGTVAAPVFAGIASRSLAYLGISPTEAPEVEEASITSILTHTEKVEGRSKIEDQAAEEIGGIMPSIYGLTKREAMRKLGGRGFRLGFEGIGFACRQSPEPGAELAGGSEIVIKFCPEAQG